MSEPARRPRTTRRDVQALRAIAVGLVLLNHFWPTHLPGGYIGVDVFFIISGFLITAHLLSEVARTGRVSLPRFTARRARRLLPAALLVSLVSLVGAIIWLPANQWERIAREIFAASAYFENWLLTASAVDYSARGDAATPVQHYWSLSVEEQFYLLWPITLIALIWVLSRTVGRRRTLPRAVGQTQHTGGTRQATGSSHPHTGHLHLGAVGNRPLALGMLAIGLASFLFACWMTEVARSAAYFNTFGRVWEFMAGAALAVLAGGIARRIEAMPGGATLAGIGQLLGYALIAASALRFTESTAFPGPWAIVPVVGTVLVIACGPKTPKWSPARLLHWRPVQYTGDISYSLYLWHWPLIVIVPFVLGRETTTPDRVVLILVSFALAALTKHVVEDPGRTRLFVHARPRRTLLAAGASIVVVGLLAGAAIVTSHGAIARETARLEALQNSGCYGAAALISAAAADCGNPFGPAEVPPRGPDDTPWFAPEECALLPHGEQVLVDERPTLTSCDFSAPNTSEPGTAAGDGAGAGSTDDGTDADGEADSGEAATDPLDVWLVGDSHAEHWKAAVYELGRERGWRVMSGMHGGCPTVNVPLAQSFGEDTPQAKREACLDWSEQISARILQDAPDLVLVSNFASTEVVDDGSGDSQPEQLARAFPDSLGAWAAHGAEVVVIRDAPTAGQAIGAACVERQGGETAGCTAPASEVLRADPMVEAAELFDNAAVSSVDLSDGFCLDGTCSGVVGGLPVFYDDDHVSRRYSATLAPLLEERLDETLRRLDRSAG
ncbi:acyltransferase family protein [Leucobacter sp. GX24907]